MRKKRDEREYLVIRYAVDLWAVVRRDDEHHRPVNEQLYTQATHAHRARRRLERDARKIDEMIKRDGAIII